MPNNGNWKTNIAIVHSHKTCMTTFCSIHKTFLSDIHISIKFQKYGTLGLFNLKYLAAWYRRISLLCSILLSVKT